MADHPSSTDATVGHAAETRPSALRVLRVVVPLVVLLVAAAWAAQTYLPRAAQRELENSQLDQLLGRSSRQPVKRIEFVDQDGDLLADSPLADDCQSPAKLVFSYVAAEDGGREATIWQSWLEALQEATDLPAEYTHYTTVDDQLAALVDGELHITAVNTGAVPTAVATSGFIPVSTFGSEDGFGYTMNMIVAADSPIKKLGDLRGKKVTFVRPNSNSGFKAPLVLLMQEQKLLPERDYDYGFSMGHDVSIEAVLSGKTDAAPVASDLLQRMIAAGEADEGAIHTIYQSERFPPVALGYAYNLKPELRDAIAKTLIDFDWSQTELAEAYGASGADRFVAVTYKDDWANIRRIDDAIDEARSQR